MCITKKNLRHENCALESQHCEHKPTAEHNTERQQQFLLSFANLDSYELVLDDRCVTNAAAVASDYL